MFTRHRQDIDTVIPSGIEEYRKSLRIHFGEQANLFIAGLRQTKAALSVDKADLSFLPGSKNFLLVAQKQLLELPSIFQINPTFTNVEFARSN
ncbi:MAG: hypothetical protein K8R02_05800 [Anaerohalosphaeraceae bacterium]|nr:hypothetical protein [Anaerohalosphaeraceae bacterium]